MPRREVTAAKCRKKHIREPRGANSNSIVPFQKTLLGKRSGKQLESVAKKYRTRKFHKAALMPELRAPVVQRMAQGETL